MKLLVACLMVCANAWTLEKLDEKYLVSYGDTNAPIKIVEFFSFQCPHCLSLYKKDFKQIKKKFIDTNKVHWIFHPIPTDLATVQGMVCLAELTISQKKIFLETLLEESEAHNPDLNVLIMTKVLELLKKPITLRNEEFLQESKAFSDAFVFLSQKEKISAVPTVELNSKLMPTDVPDFEFVENVLNGARL